MAAYVPIDLHRHRSVVMHMADDGEVLGWVRLANDPETLVAEVLKAGEAPEVAIEATYGWYWAVDALAGGWRPGASGGAVQGRRVRRAAGQERPTRLPGARRSAAAGHAARRRGSPRPRSASGGSWSATGPSWSGCAPGSRPKPTPCWPSMACSVPMTDLFGVGGRQLLAHLCAERRPVPFGLRAAHRVARRARRRVRPRDRRAHRLHRSQFWPITPAITPSKPLPGVGPVIAAIFVAEIGDVTRFASAGPSGLVVWSHAPTPRVRHHRAPRADHQTRQPSWCDGRRSKPLNSSASDSWLRRRTGTPRRATQQPLDRQDRHRPQADHAHLLRAARRRHPLPRPRRMTRPRSRPGRERACVMTPTPVAWSSS